MSFLSAFNICASGLTAQRKRLDVASENIANIETTRTESGEPYRRKMVVLQEIGDNSSFRSMDNNPEHPDADEDGYVQMPNVDWVKETIDGMSATRSYEANITAFNAIKLMAQKALEIGK